MMEVNIQLDNDRAQKLVQLQHQTHQEITALIGRAIDLYYQQQLQLLHNGSIDNQRQELETAYREASLELDPAWEVAIADGLSDETW